MDGGGFSDMTFPSNLRLASSLLPVDLQPQIGFLSDPRDNPNTHPGVHHIPVQPPSRQYSPGHYTQQQYLQGHLLPHNPIASIPSRYPESSQRTHLHEVIPRSMGYSSFVSQYENSHLPGAVPTLAHQMHHDVDRYVSRNPFSSSISTHSSPMPSDPSHSRPTSRDSTSTTDSYHDVPLSNQQIPLSHSPYPSLPRDFASPSASLSTTSSGLRPSRSPDLLPNFGIHPSLTSYHLPPESTPSKHLEYKPDHGNLDTQTASASILMSKPPGGYTSKHNGLQVASIHHSNSFEASSPTGSSPSQISSELSKLARNGKRERSLSHVLDSKSSSSASSDSDSTVHVRSKSRARTRGASSGSLSPMGHMVMELPGSSGPPTKKKKKSKMHECEICGKSFPRPSGLRTHMNTHNNARPYPCGFPGCSRTFGVRSNAKRHLRTHGILPPPSHTLAPGEAPYIVGFSTPVILPPVDSSFSHEQLQPDGGADGVNEEQCHQMSRAPFFKLRWMPPSLTSRTNARFLKSVSENDDFSDEDDDDDENDPLGLGESQRGLSEAGMGVSIPLSAAPVAVSQGSSCSSSSPLPSLGCTCPFPCSSLGLCRSKGFNGYSSSSLLANGFVPPPPNSPGFRGLMYDHGQRNTASWYQEGGASVGGAGSSHLSYHHSPQVHYLPST